MRELLFFFTLLLTVSSSIRAFPMRRSANKGKGRQHDPRDVFDLNRSFTNNQGDDAGHQFPTDSSHYSYRMESSQPMYEDLSGFDNTPSSAPPMTQHTDEQHHFEQISHHPANVNTARAKRAGKGKMPVSNLPPFWKPTSDGRVLRNPMGTSAAQHVPPPLLYLNPPEEYPDQSGGSSSIAQHRKSEEQPKPTFMDMLVYTNGDGVQKYAEYKDIQAAIKARKRNITRRKTPHDDPYDGDVMRADQLPNLRGRNPFRLTNDNFARLKPEDKQKWINAAKITRERLETNIENLNWHKKVWPNWMPRKYVEVLMYGQKESDLTAPQKELLDNHRREFPGEIPVGNWDEQEKRPYRASHLNLRKNGIHFPVPGRGRPEGDLAVLKKRIERENEAMRRKKQEQKPEEDNE